MDCLIGNEMKCHQMFRVKLYVVLQLCNVLYQIYGLRRTRHVRIEESIGIY